jgi:hypothetical protein
MSFLTVLAFSWDSMSFIRTQYSFSIGGIRLLILATQEVQSINSRVGKIGEVSPVNLTLTNQD